MNRRVTAIVVAMMAASWPVAAHDTWILPKAFRVPAGAAVELEMTSGMSFPRNETAVAPDRIAESGLRMGSRREALAANGAADGALRLSGVAPGEGVAVAWAVSRPRTLDLKPDQVEHYLEEVAAPDAQKEAWKSRGRPPVRETYFKVAKTFVRVGDAAGEATWSAPLGLAIELVPEADPTAYRVGQTVAWRLLWQGEPLRGPAVVATSPGVPKAIVMKPDEAGRVSFRLDRPGPWLLKATRLDVPAEAGADWQSQFTTATFQVAER